MVGCAENASEPFVPTQDTLVCFTSTDEESTRTAMYPNGRFKWVNSSDGDVTITDHIYVIKDDGDTVKSKTMEIINDDETKAKFYLSGTFNKPLYDIIYNGSTINDEEKNSVGLVTVKDEQVQFYPNNSTHLGLNGDCAIAKAKKDNNGGYSFKLEHQMAYLMFEPRMDLNKKATVRKIKVIEENGKNLCGTLTIDANGTSSTVLFNGKSEITLYCGKDVKAVDNGEMSTDEAKYNGFPINYDLPYEEIYGNQEKEDNPRAFMVIVPGQYKLTFEYEVESSSFYEQHASHNTALTEWLPRKTGYISKQVRKNVNVTFEKNQYYRIRHKLSDTQIEIDSDKIYKFEEYYMWGGKKWFWNDAETYPLKYDEYQSQGAPTQGSSSWFFDELEYGDVMFELHSGGGTYDWGKSENRVMGKWYRHKLANNNQSEAWSPTKTLTANQMSYYVIYGDAHYDNTTPWKLLKYGGYNGHGGNDTLLVCYGGVWFKKKAKIESEGHSFPNEKEWEINNNPNQVAAPFIHDESAGQAKQPFEGVRYNLRYCAPWTNYRYTYTNYDDFKSTNVWKKPWELDESKDSTDYFFVPCLGQIMYNSQKTPNVPTFTLVGAQGFYWTKTPLMYNIGTTSFFYYPNSLTYDYSKVENDNAFYLNIHYNYVALSWQQSGVHVKNGMRIANTSMFK